MSVKYIPVQWNTNKWIYDAVMLAAMMLYLLIFIAWGPGLVEHSRPISGPIHNARAFGSCAFLMLTVILCIGPLARLDARFLPLLYNRRHFGVMTLFVALSHLGFILDWYYAFSPTPKLEGLLTANTSFGQLLGFPFEVFGIFALLVLLVLAATSHDFWLKFLTPRLWKRMHMLIYPAYGAVVAHVALGALQGEGRGALGGVVLLSAGLVAMLHGAALLAERRRAGAEPAEGWVEIGPPEEIEDGFAKVIRLRRGARAAVFRTGARFSAISNACAHQNGPLGEGRIVDGCVTCPWHGFQYRVVDGCSPEPFTEKVPTYTLKIEAGRLWLNPEAHAPGTYVEPVIVEGLA